MTTRREITAMVDNLRQSRVVSAAVTETQTAGSADPDELLTLSEAAKLAKVSTGTIRNWTRSGALTAKRTPGGQPRYRRGDVDAAIR